MSELDGFVEGLRSVLDNKSLPYSIGTYKVGEEDLILYYGKDGPSEVARRIDFTKPSQEDLIHLANACDIATFGMNNEQVLDESYRKAGKLDTAHFSSTFDPERCGLLDSIRDMLLEGHENSKRIRVERYKLNVYGPGSHFKVHKDTPRHETMFGSLVVVFPTPHSGGSLAFRDGQVEYVFDSATAISQAEGPAVAFAAFYSDVPHEVTLVDSGCRVTITYNLYFADVSPPAIVTHFSGAYECAIKAAFRQLLANKLVLRKGGLIGFGLRHEYPLKTQDVPEEFDGLVFHPLDHLDGLLKGSDAVLRKVCRDLGLQASLQMLYHDDENGLLLCEGYADFEGDGHFDDSVWWCLWEEGGKALVPDADDNDNSVPRKTKKKRRAKATVHWASEPNPSYVKKIKQPFVAYGNDAWLAHIYSSICLIVEIPAVGKELRNDHRQ